MAALLFATCLPAFAQEMDPNMPGMDHGQTGKTDQCDGDCEIVETPPLIPYAASGSGTARLPGNEGAMHGIHIMPGDNWVIMLHGNVSTQYTHASGPRGDEKAYVTSMAMAMAEKDVSWGRIQIKSMMSLEPLMKHDGYPNLFATGEEAYGAPIVDRQHPHDLFMELAARVDVNVGESSLFLYGGPVGEPAIGPSAFMHRASAKNNPEPPITHHWFDSTHITYGVVTAGMAWSKLQVEASAFRGQEPDEHRWNIETPRLDSWAVRATWTPSPQWALQVSHAFLKQPEAAHPGENEHRTAASVHYANSKGVSAMAAFSNKLRTTGPALTAWLAEANWNVSDHHTLFGRVENVANDEYFPNLLSPLHDKLFRVTKFQMGYAWRTTLGNGPFGLALGGSLSAYAKPAALAAAYGSSPIQTTIFAKFSLGQ